MQTVFTFQFVNSLMAMQTFTLYPWAVVSFLLRSLADRKCAWGCTLWNVLMKYANPCSLSPDTDLQETKLKSMERARLSNHELLTNPKLYATRFNYWHVLDFHLILFHYVFFFSNRPKNSLQCFSSIINIIHQENVLTIWLKCAFLQEN